MTYCHSEGNLLKFILKVWSMFFVAHKNTCTDFSCVYNSIYMYMKEHSVNQQNVCECRIWKNILLINRMFVNVIILCEQLNVQKIFIQSQHKSLHLNMDRSLLPRKPVMELRAVTVEKSLRFSWFIALLCGYSISKTFMISCVIHERLLKKAL